MVADASSLYVAGSVGFGRTDLFLRKYDEAGNELWSRRMRISEGAYHVATGLAVDASGIYVAGRTWSSQGVLRKYSPAGEELWSRTVSTFNIGTVSADVSGLYVAGWTDGTTGVIRKYAAGGDELWTRQIDAGQVCACRTPPGALAADSTGVYIAGAVLLKLDPGGNMLWKLAFAGPLRAGPVSSAPSYYIGAVALDETGLYVAGGHGVCSARSVQGR
jgi:outer membrane protein assembly factor BamB